MGDVASLEALEQVTLGAVVLASDTGTALQHAPRATAFHAEEHHLSGAQELHRLIAAINHYQSAELWNIGVVLLIQDIALNHIVLCDAQQEFFKGRRTGGVLGRFEVAAEAGFRGGPVGNRVGVLLAPRLGLDLAPVVLDVGVAFQ